MLLTQISPVALRATIKGTLAGAVVLALYLAVVAATTPGLPPTTAIPTAFAVNPVIILGTAIALGFQIFSRAYISGLGCMIRNSRMIMGAGGTAFSSFLSFFSLVPLGCCGSWLFILSLLPSIFGTSASVVLIRYSKPLSFLGLAVVIGFSVLAGIRLYKEMKRRQRAGLHFEGYSFGK